MPNPSATEAPPSFGYKPAKRDPEREAENLEIVRRYLAAISGSSSRSGTG